MNGGLDDHFEMSQELYVRRGHPLCRVHAVPITTDAGYVTGYALKAVPRRRLDFDHILILPRSHSEMPSTGRPRYGDRALLPEAGHRALDVMRKAGKFALRD